MKKFIVFIVVVSTFSSCVSLVNYQSGKTLGKGTTEIVISTEVMPLDESNDELVSVAISPGISLYHGVSEKVDIGVRWEGGLAGSLGAKVQVLGGQNSKFALALDPRIGRVFVPEENRVPYAVVPGIVSFHPSEKFAILVAEEFLYLPRDDSHYSFSHSLGVEYGSGRVKFVLGATSNYYGLGFFQFGAGVKVNY